MNTSEAIISTAVTMTEDFPGPVSVSPVMLASMTILAVVILIANIIALVVMTISRKLRSNNHHVLVLFLGVSDIMVGISLMLILFALMYESALDTRIGCVFTFSLTLSSMAASFLQMLLLSLERFVAIRFAFHLEKIFGGNKKYIYLLLVWLVSIIFFTTVVTGFSQSKVVECGLRGLFDPHSIKYILISIVIFFVTVYMLTVIFYMYTICLIRKVSRRIYASQNSESRIQNNDTSFINNESRISSALSSHYSHRERIFSASLNVHCSNGVQLSSTANSETPNASSRRYLRDEFETNNIEPESHRSRRLKDLPKNRLKMEKRATITVGCILALLTICVLPLAVVETLGMLKVIFVSGDLRTALGCFMALNSLTNPLLFSVRIKEFRCELKKLCRCLMI